MTHHERVFDKVQFLGRVYNSNTDPSSLNLLRLRVWSRRGHLFAKYAFLPVLMTASLFVICAVAMTVWTGQRELILYIMLPAIDPSTLIGFYLLTVYHLFCLTLAVCGTCGADFMLVVLVFHLWPLSDIVQNMCNELNVALLKESNQQTTELRTFFNNLVRTHKEMCEYLEDISSVYFRLLFVEIYTCGMSLCINLYCLFTVIRIIMAKRVITYAICILLQITYYPLYMMTLYFVITLFTFCFLGTVAEMAVYLVLFLMFHTKTKKKLIN